jgi:VIT1/CCC1 family predicted Fe2+/Mn2+ transporter
MPPRALTPRTPLPRHDEVHRTQRTGWLRAAVLGANDGIVSTASLVLGVAASQATARGVWVAGLASLVAGAMSMAAGEYVSVHSQADTEAADLAREREELSRESAAELRELTGLYVARGLRPGLAAQVAAQLTAHDGLGAHARDELGLTPGLRARPVQAALASAAAFAGGAALPLAATAWLGTGRTMMLGVSLGSLACLAVLGALAAWAGGAPMWIGALRVTGWGALAMAMTVAVGSAFGVA